MKIPGFGKKKKAQESVPEYFQQAQPPQTTQFDGSGNAVLNPGQQIVNPGFTQGSSPVSTQAIDATNGFQIPQPGVDQWTQAAAVDPNAGQQFAAQPPAMGMVDQFVQPSLYSNPAAQPPQQQSSGMTQYVDQSAYGGFTQQQQPKSNPFGFIGGMFGGGKGGNQNNYQQDFGGGSTWGGQSFGPDTGMGYGNSAGSSAGWSALAPYFWTAVIAIGVYSLFNWVTGHYMVIGKDALACTPHQACLRIFAPRDFSLITPNEPTIAAGLKKMGQLPRFLLILIIQIAGMVYFWVEESTKVRRNANPIAQFIKHLVPLFVTSSIMFFTIGGVAPGVWALVFEMIGKTAVVPMKFPLHETFALIASRIVFWGNVQKFAYGVMFLATWTIADGIFVLFFPSK